MGAVGNAQVLGLQPIDCVFNQATAYDWLLFYCLLIPGSFIVPWLLYNIGATGWYQFIAQMLRLNRDAGSLRAKRNLQSYMDIMMSRRRSTVSSEAGLNRRSNAARVSDIVTWPFRLFFFHTIPRLFRGLKRVIWYCWNQISTRTIALWSRLSGPPLEDGDVDVEEDKEYIRRRHSRRISSMIDPEVALEARNDAKSVGAVLFESDPMIGRSAMSASKGAFWILFFLFLPTVVKNALEMFNCETRLNPPVMITDVRILCAKGKYELVTTLIKLILLPVMSILLGYVVYKNVVLRKRRELVRYLAAFNLCWVDSMGYLRMPPRIDEAIAKILRSERRMLRRLRKYMFLFSGYRTNGVLYLWDLVIMVRKILVAAILVFAPSQSIIQAVLGLIVFVAALVAHLIFKPFDDDYAREKKMRVLPSTLELISILATIGTLLAVTLSIGMDYDPIPLWLDILLFTINGGPFLFFIYLLFDAVLAKIYGRVGRGIFMTLRTENAHNAACWWKSKLPWFGWGIGVSREVVEEEGEEHVEMEEPLLSARVMEAIPSS